MPRSVEPPRDLVVDWPFGAAETPAAAYCSLIVRSLRAALDGQQISTRELARRAGLSHRTVGYLLEGATIPDVGTLAALEAALGTELLPPGRLDRS